MERASADNLCRVEGCNMMSVQALEQWILHKKLDNSTTIEQLDKHWTKFSNNRKFEVGERATKTYYNKKMQLEESDRQQQQAEKQ